MNFLSLRFCLWLILRFIRSGLFDRLLRFVIIRRLIVVGLLIVISSRSLFRAIVSVVLPILSVILPIVIPIISSVTAIIATGSVVLILRSRMVVVLSEF